MLYALNRLKTQVVHAVTGSAVVMYDSTNPDNIPLDAALVASYVDGFGGFDVAVARFGKARVVSISVNNNDADVADVEPGAMSASDLPGWVDRQVARGVRRPVVYSDSYDYPGCYAQVGNRVSYWTADPVGYPITLAGRDAVQYEWTSAWDASWVLPSFPFYPGRQSHPKPGHYPPPVLREGSHGPAVATMQQLLHRHREVVKPVLVVDGVFGAGTKTGVVEWQNFKHLVPDGICGAQTWATLTVKPNRPIPSSG